MNKNKQLIVLLFSGTFFLFSNDSGDAHLKEGKEYKFLNKVQSENPEAQEAINKLKQEFKHEKQQIDKAYGERIKTLKEERREKISDLKKEYKERMDELRKKYPDIPDVTLDPKPKPKPIHPKVKDGDSKKKKHKKKSVREKRRRFKSDSKKPVQDIEDELEDKKLDKKDKK